MRTSALSKTDLTESLKIFLSFPTRGWAVIGVGVGGVSVEKKAEAETLLFEVGLVKKRLRKGLSLIST